MSSKALRDINLEAFGLFSSLDRSIGNLLFSYIEHWFSMNEKQLFKRVLGLENLWSFGIGLSASLPVWHCL